jgi:hypothetical protein
LDDENGVNATRLEGPHAREMAWAAAESAGFVAEGAP